ncbi:MAG: manganese efflux pump [Coleofasciculaceae cyanobacterium SM2_3_26]|nr:manganese efflux pump [Coleofasciculaceae cyanobacterium SM2_3_26]
MNPSTTVLMALGLAADAFAVSLTSGLSIKHIKLNKALKIALFFGIFQALMPLLGWIVGLGFRSAIAGIDHWVAFGLLSFLGGRTICEALDTDCEAERFDPLDFFVLLGLSIATSLDALAAGLGLSVLNSSILLAATAIGAITFSVCFCGVFIGHFCGNCFSNRVELLGGMVLIGIGCKILLDHLVLEGWAFF